MKLEFKYPRLSPTLRRYRRLRGSVNVVDQPGEGSSESKELSRPNQFPTIEDVQSQDDFPEMDFGHTKRIEGNLRKIIAAGWMPAFRNVVTNEVIKSPGMHNMELLPPGAGYETGQWVDGFVDPKGMFHTRGETNAILTGGPASYFDSSEIPQHLEDPASLKRKEEVYNQWQRLDENKEAGGFGQNFNSLGSPGTGAWSQSDINDSYGNDNKYEDQDLHLGDLEQVERGVEPPYTEMTNGPMSPATDDDKTYNIVRGAGMKIGQIYFTDRYDALGMDHPDHRTMCKGQCEGTGMVPIKDDDMEEPWRALWLEAEAEHPAADGWHFVKCPDCGGSGKRVARYIFAMRQAQKVKPDGTIVVIQPPASVAKRIVEAFPYTDIAPGKLHLSLAYISEDPLSDEKLDKVKEAMELVADAHTPLHCKIKDVATADEGKTATLMATVECDGFDDLRSSIEDALKDAGFDILEAKIGPHMSLTYNLPKLASKMVYITGDGDDIGQQVGRMSIEDDVKGLQAMDKKIQAGGQVFAEFAESNDGEVIGIGGDEIRIMVPMDALEQLDDTISQYEEVTGFTISLGVGKKLSEADKAMIIAKFKGKDQVVHWEPEMEDILEEAKDKVLSKGEEKAVKHYLAAVDPGIEWDSMEMVIMCGDRKIKVPFGREPKKAQKNEQPWIAIDLDKTLLKPSPTELPLGEVDIRWVPYLQKWLDAGVRISIYTARLTRHPNEQQMIQQHLEAAGVPFTDIYIGPKPLADVFIDNSAVQFQGDPASAAAKVDKLLEYHMPHSQGKDKEANDLIDTQPGGPNEEDLYTDVDETRLDRSIPRDPGLEGPLYGR